MRATAIAEQRGRGPAMRRFSWTGLSNGLFRVAKKPLTFLHSRGGAATAAVTATPRCARDEAEHKLRALVRDVTFRVRVSGFRV